MNIVGKVGDYNIREILITDKEYPEKLKNIGKDAPKKIYVLGNLPNENKKSVAVVGARACSDYGYTLAKDIGQDLSKNDVQVISGLAIGCDTAAHIGSIEQNKPTFAVLACSVDICYPAHNQNVYDKILETGGGIISEHELGTPPLPMHFPQRNRIIAALSDIVTVVEAKERSGSLMTVDYALEYGKSVFACPSRIGDQLGIGTNKLIKQGAYIFTEMNDIYNHLQLEKTNNKKLNLSDLDYYETVVYDLLSDGAMHIEEIITNSKLPEVKVNNILMSLELKGFIEAEATNYYKKTDILIEENNIKKGFEKNNER